MVYVTIDGRISTNGINDLFKRYFAVALYLEILNLPKAYSLSMIVDKVLPICNAGKVFFIKE